MPDPNFIVIGAPKAGTTSLCNYLAGLEQVYLYENKETQFFSGKYDRGFAWYQSLFNGARDNQIIGEGTPGYALGPNTGQVAKRIHDHLPKVKLIYMVRDPIERIKSHYVQGLANGFPDIGLSKAVFERQNLIEASRYQARLNDYLAFFPREQIHIIMFDDLIADQKKTISACLKFLGLPPAEQVELAKRGARETRARDGVSLSLLKRTKPFEVLRPLIPNRIVEKVRPYFKEKINLDKVDLSLSDAAFEHIKKELQEETVQFLKNMGRPKNLWTFTN